MRYRNNDEFVNDGRQTEQRWCFKKGIIAYPVVQHKTYTSANGRKKNFVKVEININGHRLIGKGIYKQEEELKNALQKVYSHYYARRFGNEIMK